MRASHGTVPVERCVRAIQRGALAEWATRGGAPGAGPPRQHLVRHRPPTHQHGGIEEERSGGLPPAAVTSALSPPDHHSAAGCSRARLFARRVPTWLAGVLHVSHSCVPVNLCYTLGPVIPDGARRRKGACPVSQPHFSGRRSGLTVVALCFLTIVFDGYDLIVYGSVVPSLLAEPGWNSGLPRRGRSAAMR